jgi:aspartate carbamoyltransferase catalytic subunit
MNTLQHFVTIRSLDRRGFLDFFELIQDLKKQPVEELKTLLKDKIIGTIFFQPSTRTRLGFQTAALKLGANCIGFSNKAESRCVDYCNESLEDCIRVVGQMAHGIVLRHSITRAAEDAAVVSPVPIINAGDGFYEHPVQAINDIWVAYDRLGGLENRTIGVMGDPNGRVLRSFILGILQFNIKDILFLLPPGVELPRDIKAALLEAKIPYQRCEDVQELLRGADVIEVLPVVLSELKKENFALQEATTLTPYTFLINREKILRTDSKALCLHPGPRSQELDPDTDDLKNSLYFHQVKESIFVRMAILLKYLKP